VPSATYDAANRQLQFGDKQMTFDANGNLTSITSVGGATSFTWDTRDRLVGITVPGMTVSFILDAGGRRIAKEKGAEIQRFLYDNVDIIQQLENGNPVSYIRSTRIDEPLVRNGVEFYLSDALGSTTALADPTGNLTTTYLYDPFGQTMLEGGVSLNPFQYAARENDEISGVYAYRARSYVTLLLRFASEDPFTFGSGDVITDCP